MVVKNSLDLPKCRNALLEALGSSLSTTNKQTSSHENVAEQISDLKVSNQGIRMVLCTVSNG